MHVGLNLIYLVPGQTGGTETYARELVLAIREAEPDLPLTLFVNREAAGESDGAWREDLHTVTVPVHAVNRVKWVQGEQQLLPRLAREMRVDVLHSLGNTAPAWGAFRRVVTIHDLHFRRVPQAHDRLMRYGMRMLVPLAARRSHRIIVPAEATKRDLVAMLRTRAEKVEVVPEGRGRQRDTEPMALSQLRVRLNLDDRPLVLSVSAKRPHKNLVRLIEAVAAVPPERRPQLVVPGYPTSHEVELRRRAAQLGLEGDVKLLGWVTPAELEGLYAAARCLICASLHEGFGLPVLEAMARGVPVACSAGGALAEVAGGASLLFDPYSVPQIAEAIQRLISDDGTVAQLKQDGFERAARFSWERAAAQTMQVYERALSASP